MFCPYMSLHAQTCLRRCQQRKVQYRSLLSTQRAAHIIMARGSKASMSFVPHGHDSPQTPVSEVGPGVYPPLRTHSHSSVAAIPGGTEFSSSADGREVARENMRVRGGDRHCGVTIGSSHFSKHSEGLHVYASDTHEGAK